MQAGIYPNIDEDRLFELNNADSYEEISLSDDGNIYPNWINMNGKLVPLKNVATKVSTLDEFFFMYSSAIKHNPETHKKVMEILN